MDLIMGFAKEVLQEIGKSAIWLLGRGIRIVVLYFCLRVAAKVFSGAGGEARVPLADATLGQAGAVGVLVLAISGSLLIAMWKD